MSKHLFEDMVKVKRQKKEAKENKKEFREIRKEPKEILVKEIEAKGVGNVGTDYSKKRSRYMLWFVAFISATFCFFALSFLFSKAEITVNPKMKDVVLNENLSASFGSNIDGLSFNTMVISDEENLTVKASGEKSVSIKATGTVIIFNSYSSSSQTLDIDTRLEGSNGKIYKTQKKIVVPGKSKDGIAGQIEVGIYASAAGTDYNSPPLDFKIFGFKGTPKYSQFIGRSKTGTEITGGFIGKVPDISDADKANTVLDLKNTLQKKLLQKATDHPSEVIFFKDAIFFNIDDSSVSSTLNKDNSATLTLKGTLYGLLFNEEKLTQKLAEDNIEKYDGSEVYIPNIGDLTFTLVNKDNVLWEDIKNINFNLSGSIKIIWKLDVDKFTADLLGKSKKDFKQILSQYGNIDSANLTLSPFWKMSIPDEAKNIKVVVNYPK